MLVCCVRSDYERNWKLFIENPNNGIFMFKTINVWTNCEEERENETKTAGHGASNQTDDVHQVLYLYEYEIGLIWWIRQVICYFNQQHFHLLFFLLHRLFLDSSLIVDFHRIRRVVDFFALWLHKLHSVCFVTLDLFCSCFFLSFVLELTSSIVYTISVCSSSIWPKSIIQTTSCTTTNALGIQHYRTPR